MICMVILLFRVPITKVVRLPAPSLADILFIVITLGTGGLSFARGHQIATHQWKQWNSENHTSTEEFIHILTFKGTLILSILQVCASFQIETMIHEPVTLFLGFHDALLVFISKIG